MAISTESSDLALLYSCNGKSRYTIERWTQWLLLIPLIHRSFSCGNERIPDYNLSVWFQSCIVWRAVFSQWETETINSEHNLGGDTRDRSRLAVAGEAHVSTTIHQNWNDLRLSSQAVLLSNLLLERNKYKIGLVYERMQLVMSNTKALSSTEIEILVIYTWYRKGGLIVVLRWMVCFCRCALNY